MERIVGRPRMQCAVLQLRHFDGRLLACSSSFSPDRRWTVGIEAAAGRGSLGSPVPANFGASQTQELPWPLCRELRHSGAHWTHERSPYPGSGPLRTGDSDEPVSQPELLATLFLSTDCLQKAPGHPPPPPLTVASFLGRKSKQAPYNQHLTISWGLPRGQQSSRFGACFWRFWSISGPKTQKHCAAALPPLPHPEPALVRWIWPVRGARSSPLRNQDRIVLCHNGTPSAGPYAPQIEQGLQPLP